MKGSNFSKQVENLRLLVAKRDEYANAGGNRATITLQLTFMECNLNEIPKVVQLAIDMGVDRVKGHHLWAHFGEIKEQSLRRDDNAMQRWNKVAQECRELITNHNVDAQHKADKSMLTLDNFHDLEPGTQEIKSDATCPFLGQEAWINHKGRFDPCCAPDDQRLALGHFGMSSPRVEITSAHPQHPQ
eukprot:gene4286-5273_t